MARKFPERRWAARPFFPEGLAILAGPPGSGKSYYALNLALAVAQGGKAFGTLPTERGDVLYLSDYQFSYLGNYMLMFKNGILGFETSDQKSLLWQSTQATTTGNRCILEYDGNLAIYDDTHNRKVWESNFHTADPRPWLRLAPEGKFAIYGSGGQPLNPPWSRPPPPTG